MTWQQHPNIFVSNIIQPFQNKILYHIAVQIPVMSLTEDELWVYSMNVHDWLCYEKNKNHYSMA